MYLTIIKGATLSTAGFISNYREIIAFLEFSSIRTATLDSEVLVMVA